MATDRVRLQTYVDPSTAEVVRETADALDQTTSALMAEVVTYSLPMLEALRDMALAIKAHPDRAREALGGMAAAMRPMIEEVTRGAAVLELVRDAPPPSNRGGS